MVFARGLSGHEGSRLGGPKRLKRHNRSLDAWAGKSGDEAHNSTNHSALESTLRGVRRSQGLHVPPEDRTDISASDKIALEK